MKNYRNINIGICFLRLWMSFVVITCHYYTGNVAIISLMRNLAVPVFMLIAFLYFKNLLNGKKKIISRFKRLLYPYMIWPIVYWNAYNLLYIFLKWNYKTPVNSLFWQISFGSSASLLPQFWYMFDLIVITIFMLSGLYHRGGVLSIICLACIFLQYSSLNTCLFDNLKYEMKWPIGRIAEMLPYAILGIALERSHILDRCNKKKILSLFALLISGGIVIMCNQFSIIRNPDTGYGYQGINLMLISVILVMVFYLLPFEWMGCKVCYSIYALSKYSLGIYALHIMVGRVMNTIFEKNGIVCNSFLQCILIFAGSLILSYIICKLPYEWCNKIVT